MRLPVYRIEKNGIGPYCSAAKYPALEKMRERHNGDEERYPGPYNEGYSGMMLGRLSGFYGIA